MRKESNSNKDSSSIYRDSNSNEYNESSISEYNQSPTKSINSKPKIFCFYCYRRNQALNKENIRKNSEQDSNKKKDFDNLLTENLINLMKNFNIEKKFSKENTNMDNNDNNEQSLISFTNHYPKHLPFIILDCRIYLEKKEKFYDYKPGFLPMSVIVEQEEIKDEFVN